MSAKIAAHIRSNVIGYIALFVALGGTAAAQARIHSGHALIPPVNSWSVKNHSLRGIDIANGAIGSHQLENGSIGPKKIRPGSLTGAQINSSSLDFSVLQARLRQSCGEGAAIQAVDQQGNVTCSQFPESRRPAGPAGGSLAGEYPNPSFAANSVTSSALAPEAVTSNALAKESVSGGPGGAIAAESIVGGSGGQIAANSVTGEDIDQSSLDFSLLQKRVSGTCASKEAISAVGEAGGVTCAAFPTSAEPSGAAGGSLAGAYPDPSLAPEAVTSSALAKESVTSNALAPGSVSGGPGGAIAANSVTGTDIDQSSLDFGLLQKRVSGTCSGGEAISSIGEGGSVSCATPVDPRIVNPFAKQIDQGEEVTMFEGTSIFVKAVCVSSEVKVVAEAKTTPGVSLGAEATGGSLVVANLSPTPGPGETKSVELAQTSSAARGEINAYARNGSEALAGSYLIAFGHTGSGEAVCVISAGGLLS